MANINPKQSRETIVKYLLYLNLIVLIATFFINSEKILFGVLIVNILGLFLYKILTRYEPLLEPLLVANKIAKNMDKFAGKING